MGYSNEANHQQASYKKNEFENMKKFNLRQILQSEDRCHRCGDSKHTEGFQCFCLQISVQKFGHFSSLCYKKQEFYKKRPRSPKAYQLTSGRLSTQDNSICRHSSNNSASDESFCLQMKVQAVQTQTNVPAPKHLFINSDFKIKPHQNKTKFPQARIDTCTDVNIMPVSIYKYLFKDPDCAKIAPSDLQLGTYTNKKVNILGSCNILYDVYNVYYTSRYKMY